MRLNRTEQFPEHCLRIRAVTACSEFSAWSQLDEKQGQVPAVRAASPRRCGKLFHQHVLRFGRFIDCYHGLHGRSTIERVPGARGYGV